MNWIKKVFEKAKAFFTFADEKAKKLTKLAIKVTNAVKIVVDSPVDDILAEIAKRAIPGEADDILINNAMIAINKKLPVIINELVIVDTLLQVEDPVEKAKLILEKIKFASEDQKNQFYHNLASTLISQLSDGKFTFGECCVTAEIIYQEMKKNNEL
jgi:hypothetical protein